MGQERGRPKFNPFPNQLYSFPVVLLLKSSLFDFDTPASLLPSTGFLQLTPLFDSALPACQSSSHM